MYDLPTFNVLACAAAVAICAGALGVMVTGVLLAVGQDGLTLSRNEIRVAIVALGAGSLAIFVIGTIAALFSVGAS